MPNYNLADNFPTLILDDEADYASLDNNPMGEESSTINSDLVSLRQLIPRNCYAYMRLPKLFEFKSEPPNRLP